MKLLRLIKLLGVAVIFLSGHLGIAQITPSNDIVYVKPNAEGLGNGSSWENATDNLHDAIHATGVKKVFVAVGTYNVGQNSFVMKNSVEIYGGFDPGSGITDLIHKRIFASAESSIGSILDGGGLRTVISNTFTSGTVLNTTAVLDGFTIQNGKHANNAGGINNNYASPTLRNLLVKDNTGFYGGGICNLYSSPIISQVTFYNNYAAWYGGGVYNEFSSPVISHCSFVNNTAVVSGGAIDQSRLNLVLTNVLLSGNKNTGTNEYSRLSGGGAISIYSNTRATLTNVTIAGNTTNGRGGGIYVEANSSLTMQNSIVFGNTAGNLHPAIYLSSTNNLTMHNSLVEGYTATLSGNINTSGFRPQEIFTNPGAGNYTLKENSPAINKGDNSFFPELDENTRDLKENPRVTDYSDGGIIDLGAFESIYGSPLIPDANRIIYVKHVGTGLQDGSSWENATSDLHNAIHIAGVNKVFVAVGTYNVGPNSFVMRNNVEIYGGFDPSNGITNLTHNRILPINGTIEGSILDGENRGSLIRNVFTGTTLLDNTAILDGFTIKNGKATGSGGGGIYNMYASPALRNLLFKDNEAGNGGAVYNANSSPIITKVTFTNNSATEEGGAVYNYSSSPVISNSYFLDNAAGDRGGAINNNVSDMVLTNVLLLSNRTIGEDGSGGAIALFEGSSATLTNVTITKNSSLGRGGAIFIGNDSQGTIQNSIIFGNTAAVSDSNLIALGGSLAIHHSLVEGHESTSFGNIDATGMTLEGIFKSPIEGDFTLKENSPAINKGNNALFLGLNENSRDLVDFLRVSNYTNGGVIDLGAYESRYDSPINPDANSIVYVKPRATGIGDGSSWEDASSDLHNVIHAIGVKKVFVAVGAYEVGQNSFVMKNGVEIYGGFDPENGIKALAHSRILPNSGISEGSVLDGGNLKGVISNVFTQNTALNNTAVLDGFTLTGGRYITGGAMYNVYASPTLKNLSIKSNIAPNDGGGMFNLNSSSPILNNIIFENNNANYGAGLFNRNNSSPRMTDVVIRNNTAGTDGGGMYNDVDSSPSFIRVSITGNTAGNGAGMYNRTRSSPNLLNTLIANNRATNNGSAIRSESNSLPSLTNVTLVNNTSLYGIHNTTSSSVTLKNSIIFGNINGTSSASYSLVQNSSSTLNNNVNGVGVVPDDIFLSLLDRNYQLKPVSRVIDAGNNASFPNLEANSKDLAGNARVTNYLEGGIIDLGAYESFSPNSINPDTNNIVYVKHVVSGFGDGSSWNNATSDLQKAINAVGVEKVFVAIGPYKVGDHSFIMKNGVEIYGGFDPNNGITNLAHNRILAVSGNSEGSILDGDKDRPAVWNAFTENTALDTSAVLDGFTIKNGVNTAKGGGMYNLYASPVLRNLMIKENEAERGGGIYNEFSSPIITNVTFRDNLATNYGGGVYNLQGSPIITHSYFLGNTAYNYGGGIQNSASNVNITNVLFSDNKASHPYYNGGYGGGMSNSDGQLNLTNVTIANNSAKGRAGAIFNTSPNVIIKNSIIFGNTAGEVFPNIYNYQDGVHTMSHSLVEGSESTLSGNISAAGITMQNIFNNPGTGDFRLNENSPAINKGDNTLYIGLDGNTKDLTGNPRLSGQTIDMGAYEFPCVSSIDFSNVVFADSIITFDNNPHSIVARDVPSGALVTFEITDANNKTISGNTVINAGIYRIKATISDRDASCNTVVKTATLTIKKAPAIITADHIQTYVYDGTLKNVAAILSHTDTILVYSPRQGYDQAGNYEIIISAPETNNYLEATDTVSLVITKAKHTEIYFNDSTFTYDGTAKSLVVNGLSSDATALYEGNDKINAGIYSVSVTIERTNYQDSILTATLTIDKAPAIITVNPVQTHIYDGTVKNVVASLNHTETELTYSPQKGYTEVGNYEIVISGPETTNYLAAKDTVSLVVESTCLYLTITPPEITPQTVCSGSNLTLSGSCDMINSVLKWYSDVDRLYEISPELVGVTSDATYFAACVSNSTPACPSVVVAVKVAVVESLVYLSNNSFTNVYTCQNSGTTINLDTTLISGDSYILQWQKFDGVVFADLTEGLDYQQVNNDTLNLFNLELSADGSLFRAKIFNSCGMIYSDTFTLKINRLPVITTQPIGQTVCVGNQTTLSVEADGSGLVYQWQVDTGNEFVNITTLDGKYASVNTPNLVISNITHHFNNYVYRCVVFNSCQSMHSEVAVLAVDPTINIFSHPISRTACQGSTVAFTVNAVNIQNSTNISYQWQRSTNGGLTYTNISTSSVFSGVNSKTLTVAGLTSGMNNSKYRCVINGYCQSTGALLTVIPVGTVIQQPKSVEICEGNNTSFSIVAHGVGLTYRWQVNTGSGFVNIQDGDIYQGATESTLNLFYPTVKSSNYQYRCLVWGNSNCDVVADTSQAANLFIGVAAEAYAVVWNSTITENAGASQASGYILANNKITAPHGKVQYLAGQAIVLEPGFEVEAGGVFEAKVKNACQMTKGFAELPKEIRR